MNKGSFRFLVVLFALSVFAYSCSSPISGTPVVSRIGNPTNTARSEPTFTPTITASFTQTPTVTPTPIPLLYAKKVVAGPDRTCAITLSGGLKCWGNNEFGLLGDGTKEDRYYPTDVVGLTSGVVDVDLSDGFSCAVTETGGAKCWGGNWYGTLGANLGPAEVSLVPIDVYKLNTGVVAIATGEQHACALMNNGAVKCWGNNDGSLGNDIKYISNIPSDVIGLRSGAISITAGYSHNCVLMKTGGVKCWGSNGNSAILGSGYDGLHVPNYSVVDVKGLSKGVIAVTTGDDYTCALMETGSVKCWGFNNFGVLGDGTNTNRPVPVDVTGFEYPVISLSASPVSVCAVMNNGAVKCWGANILRIPGETPDDYYLPTSVIGLDNAVTSISVGGSFACALTPESSVICWGNNDDGALGNGSSTNGQSIYYIFPPVQVMCPGCETDS